MGGQVLGGGVIVLVAVLLWLVYLLPSWHSRYRYDAAERNAVRLNQALRVLAETSETPEEVRIELNTRTALAQQRLARKALAEREQAGLERSRAALELARAERAFAASLPAARRARARRRARLVLTAAALVAVSLGVWGAWEVVQTGSQWMLWSAVVAAAVCGLLLRRMARVGAKTVARESSVEAAVRASVPVQDVSLAADRTPWSPRSLPRPLTASTGSQAATMLDAAEAQEALRQAALEEAMRRRAEEQRPPSIDTARRAALARGAQSGDAAIEAHVRELLARRAAGE